MQVKLAALLFGGLLVASAGLAVFFITRPDLAHAFKPFVPYVMFVGIVALVLVTRSLLAQKSLW